MKSDDVRLIPIANGTVLDHLPTGSALKVLEILGLEKPEGAVTIALNTESKGLGKKDLVFIEGKELSEEEIGKIGLIAEGATLNLIRDHAVKKKGKVVMPDHADGLLTCMNPKCISVIEALPSRFFISKNPLRAKCIYCEKQMNGQEIINAVR